MRTRLLVVLVTYAFAALRVSLPTQTVSPLLINHKPVLVSHLSPGRILKLELGVWTGFRLVALNDTLGLLQMSLDGVDSVKQGDLLVSTAKVPGRGAVVIRNIATSGESTPIVVRGIQGPFAGQITDFRFKDAVFWVGVPHSGHLQRVSVESMSSSNIEAYVFSDVSGFSEPQIVVNNSDFLVLSRRGRLVVVGVKGSGNVAVSVTQVGVDNPTPRRKPASAAIYATLALIFIIFVAVCVLVYYGEVQDEQDEEDFGIVDPKLLPSFVFSGTTSMNGRSSDDTCVICLEDYKTGDLLRELPCSHRFHAPCIDEWMPIKPSCP